MHFGMLTILNAETGYYLLAFSQFSGSKYTAFSLQIENKTAPSPSKLNPERPITVPAFTSCPLLTDALLRQENAVKYLP
jgi:hypothetical protein